MNSDPFVQTATEALVSCQKIPSLLSARFDCNLKQLREDEDETENKKLALIRSSWFHLSSAAGTKRPFSKINPVCVSVDQEGDLTCELIAESSPMPTTLSSAQSSYSSSLRREVIIYKSPAATAAGGSNGSEFILEVWGSDGVLQAVNLSDFEAHGDVYLDDDLAKVALDRSGTKVAYVAEERRPKSQSFTKGFGANYKVDPDQETTNLKVRRGRQYEFQEDWGEQMVGKAQTVIVTLDLKSLELHVWSRKRIDGNSDDDKSRHHECLPNDFCFGQLEWDASGDNCYGIGVATSPRRLGMIYCSNRPSHVFKLNVEAGGSVDDDVTRYEIVSGKPGQKLSCRKPRWVQSGDGNSNNEDGDVVAKQQFLIWLERDLGLDGVYPGPHCDQFRLMKLDVAKKKEPEVCIDVVKSFDPEKDQFAGLFNASFPENCVLPSAAAGAVVVVINCVVTHFCQPIVCDVASGRHQVLEGGDHVEIHDVAPTACGDVSLVVGGHSTPVQPDRVVIGSLRRKKKTEFAFSFEPVVGSSDPPDSGHVWKTFYHVSKDDSSVKFNSVYVGPEESSSSLTAAVPLVVWIHGGPHAVFRSSFLRDVTYFLRLGYAVLAVNYRGSLGSGQDCVTSLLGHVGDRDVKDCVQAVEECVQAVRCLDRGRIFLFGGSHGGFLVVHLAGQHPDMFRAGVACNPVVDLPSMAQVTDIPDWVHNEPGVSYDESAFVDGQLLDKMYRASPSFHASRIKAPIYLMIGKNDLRVPPRQGIELYHKLKAMGKDVRMNVYEDSHPLSKLPVRTDVMINTALFFNDVAASQ